MMTKITPQHNRHILLTLVFLLGMSALLATDMYVPALPHITVLLHTTPYLTKLTITVYLLGLALSPLIIGPMSDRFGRRRLLLSCSSIALVGMILASTAPTIELLIIARLIQGVGLGVIVSLLRTISRDLFYGSELARVISVLSLGISLGPAVAPVIGGYLQDLWGWRSIFIVLSLQISTLGVLAFLFLPETAEQLSPKATQIKTIIKNYKILLCSPIFMGFVTCSSMALAGNIIFYSLSPFIFHHQYQLSAVQYGWLVSLITLMMIIGRMINIPLVRYFDGIHCIILGLTTMLFSSIALLILSMLNLHSIWGIIIPMMFFIIGSSPIFSNAMVGAFGPFKHIGGAAGALYSALQMFGCFIAGFFASILPSQPIVLALLLLIVTLVALIVFSLTIPFKFSLQYISQLKQTSMKKMANPIHPN